MRPMKPNSAIEFINVLCVAVLIGGAAMFSVMYLEGVFLEVAVVGIVALVIVSWHFLRKRFGRYE